jgi:hypothetical protein
LNFGQDSLFMSTFSSVERRWIGTPYRHPKGALTQFWCG